MHALWNNSLQSSNTGKYPEMFVTCTTILNHLIGFKEVITVYCEIHTQHTLQKKKIRFFFNDKSVGTSNNQHAVLG